MLCILKSFVFEGTFFISTLWKEKKKKTENTQRMQYYQNLHREMSVLSFDRRSPTFFSYHTNEIMKVILWRKAHKCGKIIRILLNNVEIKNRGIDKILTILYDKYES